MYIVDDDGAALLYAHTWYGSRWVTLADDLGSVAPVDVVDSPSGTHAPAVHTPDGQDVPSGSGDSMHPCVMSHWLVTHGDDGAGQLVDSPPPQSPRLQVVPFVQTLPSSQVVPSSAP